MKKALFSEIGQGLVEYGMILLFIIAAIPIILIPLGDITGSNFEESATEIADVNTNPGVEITGDGTIVDEDGEQVGIVDDQGTIIVVVVPPPEPDTSCGNNGNGNDNGNGNSNCKGNNGNAYGIYGKIIDKIKKTK